MLLALTCANYSVHIYYFTIISIYTGFNNQRDHENVHCTNQQFFLTAGTINYNQLIIWLRPSEQ